MDFPVNAAVAPVHVHVNGRIDHRVIQCGKKARLLVFRAFARHYAKFAFPCLRRLAPDLLERFPASFGGQVFQSALLRDARESDFHL